MKEKPFWNLSQKLCKLNQDCFLALVDVFPVQKTCFNFKIAISTLLFQCTYKFYSICVSAKVFVIQQSIHGWLIKNLKANFNSNSLEMKMKEMYIFQNSKSMTFWLNLIVKKNLNFDAFCIFCLFQYLNENRVQDL